MTPVEWGDLTLRGDTITLAQHATLKVPTAPAWRPSNDGESTQLEPWFEPMITLHRQSKVATVNNAIFLVAVPSFDIIPETVDRTGEAATKGFVVQVWGKGGTDTKYRTRTTRTVPGLRKDLAAWRITADFVNPNDGGTFVVDFTWYQVTPGDWMVVGAVMSEVVDDTVMAELETSLTSVTPLG